MGDSTSDLIETVCSCGAKLKVHREAAGRKAKCPKCGNVFIVAAAPPPRDADEEPHRELDDWSAFKDLSELEKTAEAVEVSGGPRRMRECPHCGAVMPADAALCIACGYNVQTGRSSRTILSKDSKAVVVARRVALGAGTFALGCFLSLAGALIGAGVWAVIAIAAGVEIGYVAIGLGVLAGVGMTLGYREKNRRAGIVAGAFALAGIFIAKAGIFIYLNYPEIQATQRGIASVGTERTERIRRLATHRAKQRAREEALVPGDFEGGMRMLRESFEHYAFLSTEELDEELRKLDEWEAGGKYADERFVRNYLVYQFAREAGEAAGAYEDGEYGTKTDPHWHDRYREACEKADAMSPEDRVAAAKEFEKKRNREDRVDAVAHHHADKRAVIEGLSPADEKRSAYRKEEKEKRKSVSDEDLAAAEAAIEAWNNGGKWNDADYIRSFYAFELAEEALEAPDVESDRADKDGDNPPPFDEDGWRRRYEAAVGRANALTLEQQVQALRERENKRQRENEEEMAAYRREAARGAAGDAFKFILENYFTLIDVVFILLAVGAAYGIAGRETESGGE